MNNNIWGKSLYNNVINSYMKAPSSPKIKGTLKEINENRIKLNVGDDKSLNITLREPINAKVGDSIVIDKKNIVKSEIVNNMQAQATQINQTKYDYILSSLEIPKSEESINAVSTLDNYGVDVTKDNVLSFMSAKNQLSTISEKLDYDTVIKLKDNDVDFEKESLQKVLQEMQNVQGGKPSFSFLKFLRIKGDMSTDKAEKIAQDIYGNKMGKDITDIIKALDKAGLEPNKKNIDEINNIFSKLHNIENIEDKTIIDSVKNKIEASIDNLYKLKNAVVRGSIEAGEKMGRIAHRINDAYNAASSSVSEADLKQMEDGIRARLEDLGIKVTDKLVELSKEVITRGLDLTTENLEKIMSIRGAIEELSTNLTYEDTAILMAVDIDTSKVDLVELTDMIGILDETATENINLGLDRLEILELIESIDIKTLALHMKLDIPLTLEGLNMSQQIIDGEINSEEWLNNLQNLQGYEDILTKTDSETLKNIIYNLINNQGEDLDLTAENYMRTNISRLGNIVDESYGKEMVIALMENNITLNSINMNELYMVKRNLDNIRDNINTDFMENTMETGTKIDKLNLDYLSRLIGSMAEEQGNKEGRVEDIIKNTSEAAEIVDKMKGLVDVLKNISPGQKDGIISLLMKNSMPLTLKEVQNLSFFLNNKKQIGEKLDDILNLVDRNSKEEIIKLTEQIKVAINKINQNIKDGKQIDEKPYEDFSRLLKELEKQSSFLSKEDQSSLQKNGKELLDSLELQLQLNREDTLLQLPLMVGDQLKNLQMYIMRDKRGGKKIDPKNMSVLLNFDTNNMGNVNIYIAVNYKNIVMKMGLGTKEDQNIVEDYMKDLQKHLEDLGYDLKDISFRVDEDTSILSMVEETEGNHRTLNKLLDIRV